MARVLSEKWRMVAGVEKYAYVCMYVCKQETIRLVLTPAHMGIFWMFQLMVEQSFGNSGPGDWTTWSSPLFASCG